MTTRNTDTEQVLLPSPEKVVNLPDTPLADPGYWEPERLDPFQVRLRVALAEQHQVLSPEPACGPPATFQFELPEGSSVKEEKEHITDLVKMTGLYDFASEILKEVIEQKQKGGSMAPFYNVLPAVVKGLLSVSSWLSVEEVNVLRETFQSREAYKPDCGCSPKGLMFSLVKHFQDIDPYADYKPAPARGPEPDLTIEQELRGIDPHGLIFKPQTLCSNCQKPEGSHDSYNVPGMLLCNFSDARNLLFPPFSVMFEWGLKQGDEAVFDEYSVWQWAKNECLLPGEEEDDGFDTVSFFWDNIVPAVRDNYFQTSPAPACGPPADVLRTLEQAEAEYGEDWPDRTDFDPATGRTTRRDPAGLVPDTLQIFKSGEVLSEIRGEN